MSAIDMKCKKCGWRKINASEKTMIYVCPNCLLEKAKSEGCAPSEIPNSSPPAREALVVGAVFPPIGSCGECGHWPLHAMKCSHSYVNKVPGSPPGGEG